MSVTRPGKTFLRPIRTGDKGDVEKRTLSLYPDKTRGIQKKSGSRKSRTSFSNPSSTRFFLLFKSPVPFPWTFPFSTHAEKTFCPSRKKTEKSSRTGTDRDWNTGEETAPFLLPAVEDTAPTPWRTLHEPDSGRSRFTRRPERGRGNYSPYSQFH